MKTVCAWCGASWPTMPPEMRRIEVRTWTAAIVGAINVDELRQTWASLTATPTWAEASPELRRYWVALKDSVKEALLP